MDVVIRLNYRKVTLVRPILGPTQTDRLCQSENRWFTSSPGLDFIIKDLPSVLSSIYSQCYQVFTLSVIKDLLSNKDEVPFKIGVYMYGNIALSVQK